MSEQPQSAEVGVWKWDGGEVRAAQDVVAVEEPLEIRVAYGEAGARQVMPVAVTMRTPGHDVELALGFLLSEGVIRSPDAVDRVEFCGAEVPPHRAQNVVRVELAAGVQVDVKKLQRNVFTSSSCGVCGKATLEGLKMVGARKMESGFVVKSELLTRLPGELRAAQAVFDRTGGLHAAALFDGGGKLEALREDVGRHNAMDKLIGSQFGRLPVNERVVMLSGRLSFELVQKAVVAGVPVVAAVGAPSSLAVELAQEFGVTLVGFLREGRFNVYVGEGRIIWRDGTTKS